MLRAAISEEETERTESMALTQTEILEGEEGCCHRTSGGLTFAMTVLGSKGGVGGGEGKIRELTDIFVV